MSETIQAFRIVNGERTPWVIVLDADRTIVEYRPAGKRVQSPFLRPSSAEPSTPQPQHHVTPVRSDTSDERQFREAFLEGPIDELSETLRELRLELDQRISAQDCTDCNRRALRNQYAERALGIRWASREEKPVAPEGV